MLIEKEGSHAQEKMRMIKDFKLEMKLKDAIIKSLNSRNNDFYMAVKKMVKMIEYPRLIKLANRLVKIENTNQVSSSITALKVQELKDPELTQDLENSKNLFDDFPPLMKKALLEAVRELNNPGVFPYNNIGSTLNGCKEGESDR